MHDKDEPVVGFLRSRYLARYWRGRLQIQAYRDGGFIVAWNGRYGISFGRDPRSGWALEAVIDLRGASLNLVHRDGALAVVFHGDPV